jgi:hypothetical protein
MRAFCLLLVVILTGCASTQYQADPTAVRFISVSFSGGPGPSGGGYLADGRFLVESSFEVKAGGHVHESQTKTELTPAQWSAFWRAVDELGIERWRPRYSSDGMEDTVSDTPRWSVDLRRGGKSFHSEGDAAGPQVGHPSRRTLSPGAVDELSRIFARFAKVSPLS